MSHGVRSCQLHMTSLVLRRPPRCWKYRFVFACLGSHISIPAPVWRAPRSHCHLGQVEVKICHYDGEFRRAGPQVDAGSAAGVTFNAHEATGWRVNVLLLMLLMLFMADKLWPQVGLGEGFPPAKRPTRDTPCNAAWGHVQVSFRNARLNGVEGQLAGELQLVCEREYILLNPVVCHGCKEDS